MADTPSVKKGDRVFWWTKNDRAYSSAVSGCYKRYGTITKVKGRFDRLAEPWQDKRRAEITCEDSPQHTTIIGLPFLHKA